MKRSTIPMEEKQLQKMYENGTLIMKHPIQRRGGQWDDYNKGLFINSMCNNFIIPAVYMLKEPTGNYDRKNRLINNYFVLDGKQRLTTVFDFCNDEFRIHEEIPNVEIEDEEYEIAGKLFSELDEEVQQEIKRFRFTLYNLEECTDEEIEECFFRLNNGVALTKSQKAKVKIGVKLAGFINEILERRFYTEIAHFTKTQFRSAQDQCTLLQAMMLLDVKAGEYELNSISENDILDYAENIHDNYSDEKKNRIVEIMDYLEKAFEKKEKFMKKINVPMFIYMADEAIDKDITASEFYEWFKQFSEGYNPDCEYAKFCGAGSIKKVNTLGRIEILKRDFEDYFNTENDSDDNSQNDVEEENEPKSATPITDGFMNDSEEDDGLDGELPFC